MLITGATGTLGSHVLPRLRLSGKDLRILSRKPLEGDPKVEVMQGDLSTGDGVERAMTDVETVVHLAGTAKGDDLKARHLVEAATRSGVRHIVFISVVGADRVPLRSMLDRAMFGYFGAKRAAEGIIAESGIPWTILRATQFHDLTFKTVAGMAKMPVVPMPSGWMVQPIASSEVAERLVELALAEPAGLVPAMGGPRVYEMADLVRSYMDASGKRRPIMPILLGGSAFRAVRGGATLVPDRAVGRRSWEEFLQECLSVPDGKLIARQA
jgi:uncharacterized protein YbjT (DUF2867 family)